MDGAGAGHLQCDDGDYADIEAALNHFTAPHWFAKRGGMLSAYT